MNPFARRTSCPASWITLAVLACLLPLVASGQWIDQRISLRPGWNAVFLEVQPEPAECDAVFAGLPVESVWRFNRKQAVVQFISDPNQLVIAQPDWLMWVSPSNPLAGRINLHFLDRGRPYLVKMADNAPSIIWTVRGKPVQRAIEWLRDSHNFIGVSLPPTNAPTYRAFTSWSSALIETNIYRIQANGNWQRVTAPATTLMQQGEAFWIRTIGLPAYSGPLVVETDRRAGLEYGRILTEQTLRIRNISTNSTMVIVRPLSSTNPPIVSKIALAGPVPMGYWQNDFAANRAGWTNLTGVIQSNVPPGGTWQLRIEVRRREMNAFVPPVGTVDARVPND